jgi:hypothetical protein
VDPSNISGKLEYQEQAFTHRQGPLEPVYQNHPGQGLDNESKTVKLDMTHHLFAQTALCAFSFPTSTAEMAGTHLTPAIARFPIFLFFVSV